MSEEVRISKALSYLLRHAGPSLGLQIRSDGFAKLDDILSQPRLKGATVEKIKEIVANNDKQRFKLIEEDGVLMIRANQGHSLEIVTDLELQPLEDASQAPAVVVHGTYFCNWDSIKQTGLCRMSRQHIHFAPGLPGDEEVISGMRKSCEVFIIIDIPKATAAGIKFFRSANNVILSPGEGPRGIIAPCYFLRVLNARTRHPIAM